MAEDFEYQINDEARAQLNAGFRDAFEALKISDYKEYLAQANVLSKAFGVSRDTVGRWLNGTQDFVGKGDPRRIGGQAQGISKNKVYSMRVAFSKAVILGGYLPEKIGNIQTKSKAIPSGNASVSGLKLRDYLANDFTRERAIRATFSNGMLTWLYARYEKYPDQDESSDIEDWSTTVQYWNPGIDSNDSFPYGA